MGKIARAKAGLHQGSGNIPIGYDYRDGKLYVNLYEAEQVKKIYEWYLGGASYSKIAKRLREMGYTNKYSSYNSCGGIINILNNPVYTGQLHYGGVVVENAHEAIITKEDFEQVKSVRAKRSEMYSTNSLFCPNHLLTGLVFCGYCGSRYYCRAVKNYFYYCCYSRTKQIARMVKDPNCKNKNWRMEKLEPIIEERVRELLRSPETAFEISQLKRQEQKPESPKNSEIERRIREIDKQINKFMELYQLDGIPPEVLSDNIRKLYNEKTALNAMLEPVEKIVTTPFNLVEELLRNAAQVWDFADTNQKRRILQDLIKRIVLTDDKIDIEWNF